MNGHGDAMGADGPAMDGAVLPVHGVDGQRSASEGMAAEAADRQPSDAAPKSLSLSQARLHVATTMPSQTVQHFPLSSTVPETMQVQSAVAVAPAVTPAVTATAVHVAAPVATQSTARVAPLAPPHCDPAESVRYWHDLHDSARFSFPTLEAALTFGRTVAARWNFGLRIKSTMVNATTVHKVIGLNKQYWSVSTHIS